MNLPSLRKLQHAQILAETLNYASAAKKLHLTQSALTRSIQSLEQELGFTLFDRNLGGVKITPDGELLLQRARTLLIHANSFSHEVAAMQRLDSGQAAIGFGPGIQSLFLPSLLVDISQQYPGMSISIEIESAERLLSMLLDEQLEFIVVYYQLPELAERELLEAETLITVPLQVYGRKGHPLTRLKLPANELQELSLRYPQICVQFDLVRYQFGSLPEADYPPLIRCNDLNSLGQVVSCSDGLWVGFDSMMKPYLEDGSIVPMPVRLMQQEVTTISLFKLKQRTLSLSAAAVAEWIRHHLLING